MIDIHSHILYELDDGASDVEETVRMLHIAEKDGIKKMVVTPHYIYGSNKYDISELIDRIHKVQTMIRNDCLNLLLYPGNELYLDLNLLHNLQQGYCLSLANSEYILLNFDEHYPIIQKCVYSLFEE